jgi:hypothetical protein
MFCLYFSGIIRYKKRERGKLVHAYSSKDLQGILVSSKSIVVAKLMSPHSSL